MPDHLIFHKSRPGKVGFVVPEIDVPEIRISEVFDHEALRKTDAPLPEVSEPEVVRHYTSLSAKN
ncbi:MAG: aminomethyl-transferring glycine dehydrogenase subunit GcvPB, partial [Fidelibacterota bacterium]